MALRSMRMQLSGLRSLRIPLWAMIMKKIMTIMTIMRRTMTTMKKRSPTQMDSLGILTVRLRAVPLAFLSWVIRDFLDFHITLLSQDTAFHQARILMLVTKRMTKITTKIMTKITTKITTIMVVRKSSLCGLL